MTGMRHHTQLIFVILLENIKVPTHCQALSFVGEVRTWERESSIAGSGTLVLWESGHFLCHNVGILEGYCLSYKNGERNHLHIHLGAAT
jgi:hypothetical protein